MKRVSLSRTKWIACLLGVGLTVLSIPGCKLPDAGPRPMVMPAHPVPNLPSVIPGKHYSNSQPGKSPLKSLMKPIMHRGN